MRGGGVLLKSDEDTVWVGMFRIWAWVSLYNTIGPRAIYMCV